MADDDDESWLQGVDTKPTKKAKRKMLVRLDDLLADSYIQEKEKKNTRVETEVSDEDDDEEDNAFDGIADFIDKCASQVGDGSDMREAPQWGEVVFGTKKEAPDFVLNGTITNLMDCLAGASRSLEPCFPAGGTASEVDEAFLAKLLEGNLILPLVHHIGPDLQRWTFHLLAYSEDRSVQKAACQALCDALLMDEDEKNPCTWHPAMSDFMEALKCYGYVSTAGSGDCREKDVPPSNITSLLRFLCFCCTRRHVRIFSATDVLELLFVLARCSLDRRLQCLFVLFHDCFQALVGYLSKDDWELHHHRIATSLGSVSKELVNLMHVLQQLRGPRDRIEVLHKQIALQLLSKMANKELRNSSDILADLKPVDPKQPSIDFVELHHKLTLVDLWLRYDSSFKSRDEDFNTWLSILRGLSVRISCGDYRTFATKVRNTAAFLISMYTSRPNSRTGVQPFISSP